MAAEVLREALFLHSEVIWLWSKLLARRARGFAEYLTKKGPHLDHDTAIQRKTNSLLFDFATELFQRGPDYYYFVWVQQDFPFKVAGKGQTGAKPGEHDVTYKTVSLSQPTMTGRPVPNPADKVQNVHF